MSKLTGREHNIITRWKAPAYAEARRMIIPQVRAWLGEPYHSVADGLYLGIILALSTLDMGKDAAETIFKWEAAQQEAA